MNPKVTDYIASQTKWQTELKMIRSVLLELHLEEVIKWGIPAYIYKKKNILGLSAFKNYCGIWFHHGVFLKDEANILINAQKDKTIGMRQMRFESFKEINTDQIRQYVLEAMANSEEGKEIKPKRNKSPVVIPVELKDAFSKNEKLKYAFNELSLSKQREYCNYILEAKREATKQSRLEKIVPMILNKVGLHEKYRNC